MYLLVRIKHISWKYFTHKFLVNINDVQVSIDVLSVATAIEKKRKSL